MELQSAVTLEKVSIPFKRERLSELSVFSIYRLLIKVSIPFKRERLSERIMPKSKTVNAMGKFQFPSNGKGFPNLNGALECSRAGMGFNSLQTGKAFRTTKGHPPLPHPDKFQFPSNGKGFPNSTPSEPCHSAG